MRVAEIIVKEQIAADLGELLLIQLGMLVHDVLANELGFPEQLCGQLTPVLAVCHLGGVIVEEPIHGLGHEVSTHPEVQHPLAIHPRPHLVVQLTLLFCLPIRVSLAIRGAVTAVASGVFSL